mgnify:CR=1 FL=1|jgi:hypothetical protein
MKKLCQITMLLLVISCSLAFTASVFAACFGKQFQTTTIVPSTCGTTFGYCQPGNCTYYIYSANCYWCGMASTEAPPTGIRLVDEQPASITVYKTTGTCEPDWIGCDDCDYTSAVTVVDPTGAACYVCNWTSDGC